MQMNVGAHQLNNQRHRGAMRDQVKERLLSENPWPQIQVIVFRPAGNHRLLQKRTCQPVYSRHETIDRLRRKSIGHYQEAIVLEGLALLGFETNKVQGGLPFHSITARGALRTCSA